MIPNILPLQVDAECSAPLRKRAADLIASIEKLTADAKKLDDDRTAFAERPLEELGLGESEGFRDAETALLIKGLGICRDLESLDNDHRAELADLASRANLDLEAERVRVHDGLVEFGYRPRIDGVTDSCAITPMMIEMHTGVTRLRLRSDELRTRSNARDFANQNAATLRAIEGRLKSLREKLAHV